MKKGKTNFRKTLDFVSYSNTHIKYLFRFQFSIKKIQRQTYISILSKYLNGMRNKRRFVEILVAVLNFAAKITDMFKTGPRSAAYCTIIKTYTITVTQNYPNLSPESFQSKKFAKIFSFLLALVHPFQEK